ncbi:MAG: hypothetical protein ACFFDT_23210, partial [Candidatus Hodarchaeota archaeon]
MQNVEAVSVMIAAISVIIGVINHIKTSRDQNRIQQSRLFMELYSQMRSKDFVGDTRELISWQWEDFEDFRNKYGSRADKEANTLFYSVANFFDGIGVLVERNELDPKLVEDLMSS